MTEEIHSLGEMRAFAERLIVELGNARSDDQATVLGLRGELGAGKTAFTKQLAATIGIKGTVKSPTFVLQQIYEIPEDKKRETRFAKLVHIDAYRMEDDTELDHLNWHELVHDPRNLIVIEWPERVGGKLPEDTKYMEFEFIDESARKICY